MTNDLQENVSPSNGDPWVVRDEQARAYVVDAVTCLGSIVRPMLGPEGGEKLILTESPEGEAETVVTGDAGVALDAIQRGGGFNHPVAALFVDTADSMRRQLGDGTGTAVVLGAELLSLGLDLIERGLHSSNVTIGYSMAAVRVGEFLDDYAHEVSVDDRDALRDVAATSMTSNLGGRVRDEYASMVAETIRRLATRESDRGLNTDDVTVTITTGSAATELHRGVIVRRWPKGEDELDIGTTEFDWHLRTEPLSDAGIAVMDRDIDFERTSTPFGDDNSSGIRIGSSADLDRYISGLEGRQRGAATRLRGMGVDVLVCQEKLDRAVCREFEGAGILVVDKVETPLSDVARIARATDGQVVSRLNDLHPERVGTAASVYERRINDEKWTVFERGNVGDEVYTLVARTPVESRVGHHRNAIEKAIDVTRVCALDRQVIPGAGATMMALSADLREYATTIPGKEQLAVTAFAEAFENVVAALARNAGYDPLTTVSTLRTEHARLDGLAAVGVGAAGVGTIDAWEASVIEPRRVLSQVIETARTVTRRLLTVDAVLYPGVDLDQYAPNAEHD